MTIFDPSIPVYQQFLMLCVAGCSLLCPFCIIYGALCRWGNAAAQPAPPSCYGSEGKGFPAQWAQSLAMVYLLFYAFTAWSNITYTPSEEKMALADLIYATVVQNAFSLPLIVILFLQPRPGRPKYTFLWMWPAIFAGLGALLVFLVGLDQSGFAEWVQNVSGCPENQEVVDDFLGAGLAERVVLGVSACVMAPIVEECFFRGFLYTTLRHWAGPVAAAIASSLFFACVHTALVQMLPLTAVGIILCLLYERFRTLWVPITFHALFNLSNLLLMMQ